MSEHNKVLVLGQQDRDIDFTHLYTYLDGQDNVDVKVLAKAEIKQLKKTLGKISTSGYDRVLLDLPFSKTVKAISSLQKLPGLIIFEEDACQNFLAASKWRGAFEKYYRALPDATLVLCGYNTASRYQALGFNPEIVPKGFDAQSLFNTNSKRDIELAFIGRTQSNVYSGRLELLNAVARQFDLATLRTTSIDEYRETLNRIQLFLSADVGLGEYMAKNFEAMACGCTVIASYQGGLDEEKLGFVDMENIVLYKDAAEAIAKIRLLKAEPELAKNIARAGQAHVENRFSHKHIADQLIKIARSPAPPTTKKPGTIQRVIQRLRG